MKSCDYGDCSEKGENISRLSPEGFLVATGNKAYSFREAYQKTAAIVNLAEKKKKRLDELNLEELKKIEPRLTNVVLKVFDLKNSINSKNSYGGTSFDNIKKMILKYKKQK